MRVIVNVGLLLAAIKNNRWRGVEEAAAHCRVGTNSIKKLMNGEIPRLDALFRICDGCGIQVKELIRATSFEKTNGPRGRVVSGRWPEHQVAKDDDEAAG